jgi:hypothetical protein
MTLEEQLLEVKEDINNLKTLIVQLLLEDRLEKIFANQLSGFKAHISQELDQLHKLLEEQKIGSGQQYEPDQERPNAKNDQNNWLDQTLIIDPLQEKVIFYAGLPVNGIFFANKISNQFTARKTLYRIILDRANAETGLLDLVTDDDTLATAFHLPDTYLNACELRGIGNLSYEKMKNHQPGKVQLEGPNWVIEHKITIEFDE